MGTYNIAEGGIGKIVGVQGMSGPGPISIDTGMGTSSYFDDIIHKITNFEEQLQEMAELKHRISRLEKELLLLKKNSNLLFD